MFICSQEPQHQVQACGPRSHSPNQDQTQMRFLPCIVKSPQVRIFKLRTVQSRKLVHVSHVHCHMCASSTSGCTLLYSTVQSTVVRYLYFKPRRSGSKSKSSDDVAGTTVLFKVLYCKIKNVFFIFWVCFLCIICVKSFINLLQYSTIQSIALVGYLG